MSHQAPPPAYPEHFQPATATKPKSPLKKILGITAIIALIILSFAGGCSTGYNVGYDSAKEDFAEAFDSSLSTPSGATGDDESDPSANTDPTVLQEGMSVEVPCSLYYPEKGSCMTLTLKSVDPAAPCSTEYAEPGRYVALTFEATMPENADPDFTSPFRSSPWSVATTEGQLTRTDEEVGCSLDNNHLDLMQEFPGYSATGTSWLPVPESATEILFESDREVLFTVPLQ